MWTDANVILADIRDLLSNEAGNKLMAKAFLPKCEECGHLLTHRGVVHGYIVLECARCKIPYLQAGMARPAVERSTPVVPVNGQALPLAGPGDPRDPPKAKNRVRPARKTKALRTRKARA